MVTAVVAACAVLGACGLILLALRRARTHSDQRIEAILRRIDAHLEAMSTGVARAVDAVEESSLQGTLPVLTLDFDELLDFLLAEARARTGADAVALRVEGPGRRPVVAAIGAGVETENLGRSFGPPDGRAFDAAVIDWTYSASGEPADTRFQSALVTSLASTTEIPGTLAAYAIERDAFRSEHATAVHALLRDAAVALSNARRFAEMEARVNVDPATGVPNRRGYELELGREVARAHRTGRPLSVIVVSVEGRAGRGVADEAGTIGEVARLVTGVTRRSDISCRRGERELAILLPGTEESGATVLTNRLEDEARQKLAAGTSTVTVGLVERRPSETPEALDARIEGTIVGPRVASVAALDDVRNASTAVASTIHSTLASGFDLVRPQASDVLRRDTLDALARELAGARTYGRSVALVALDIDGLESISERRGREVADSTLSRVAGRLYRSLGTGSVHRLDTNAFALVLPGSGVDDAEALVDALQSSFEPPHDEAGLVLSAGITELTEDDDAEAGLGRAEHALWQATQAGSGTVVVAVPNRRPARPR
ncbi:MAG TPA: diguanylate cyclase [Gaiellaceae bacterium]|nr:diguanylate cyclase [Gaiellaceae bacterium]